MAGGALVLLVALLAVARGSAVVARERAEAAADLAALATADGIGLDASTMTMCRRGIVIAAEDDAQVDHCVVSIDADGRTGTVDVTVSVVVRLAGIGPTVVNAAARAGRLAWNGPTTKPP